MAPLPSLLSPKLNSFAETFAVAIDISRVWHKALISKLPSYGLYLSLCNFFWSLHSDRSIAAMVEGHCSSPKSINSGVFQVRILFCYPLSYYDSLMIWTKLLTLSSPMLMIPPYIFPRPFREELPFSMSTGHTGTPQNASLLIFFLRFLIGAEEA